MASILSFPHSDPAAPRPTVVRHAAEREAQIAATIARNQHELSRSASLVHLHRAQKLVAIAPTEP